MLDSPSAIWFKQISRIVSSSLFIWPSFLPIVWLMLANLSSGVPGSLLHACPDGVQFRYSTFLQEISKSAPSVDHLSASAMLFLPTAFQQSGLYHSLQPQSAQVERGVRHPKL